MRITPKQYSVLLYELTHDVVQKEIARRTRSFLDLLVKNRALHQLPKILHFYRAHYNTREGVVDVEVTTAREVEKKVADALNRVGWGLVPHRGEAPNVSEQSTVRGQQGPALQTTFHIDSALLGGARIRVGDWMVDDTLKARLNSLRSSL